MRENPPLRSRRALSAGAAFVLTGALTLGVSGCADDDPTLRTPDGKVISTVTSRIAEADVQNPARDFTKTCLEPTETDPGRADVARILVTDPALLDAVCALGIGDKVTAVTTGPGTVPAYLGPQLAAVPAIGTTPSAQQVATARPDLVLSSPATADQLAAVRATGRLGDAEIATVPTGADWRATFTETADALGRSRAAADRLGEYDAEVTRTGRVKDASHDQVSLVRFTPDGRYLEGSDSFAGSILAAVGAQRPAGQRGAEPVKLTDENFTDADGDQIYVSYDGDDARSTAIDVLESDRWMNLGASSWNRVLWVDDEVWYRTRGLAAAWLVLNDLKESLG
ncbi:ABC transporter substrate-binding protein [Gordonia sp. VNK21]|uniref:ABC transporter substrate-binding protein n=1 Tax=Gordonia sp. VNK21 TaxID=3382483 RepID=UPI0038D44AA9